MRARVQRSRAARLALAAVRVAAVHFAAVTFAAVTSAAVLFTACANATPGGRAYLEAARGAQEEAEADASAAGDAALRAFLDTPVPEGMAPEDARALQRDAAYQLGRRLLGRGDAVAAEAVADAALEDPAMDVLTASLFVLRGEAREARERLREAAADYHEALQINERLLERALAREATR